MALSKLTAAALAVGAAKGNFGAGAVLQVVQGTKTDLTYFSTTSYVNCGLSASITPSSPTSKILVFCNFLHGTRTPSSAGQNNMSAFTLFRDGVNVHGSGSSTGFYETQNTDTGGNTYQEETNESAICWLDSPNKTTATTYSLYGKCDNIANTIVINGRAFGNGANPGVCTITLMEIAG